MLPAVLLIAVAAAPAPAAAERVKVLVLDVKSTDLSPSEVETLTSLVTAHISRYAQLDVMSGSDIKRLVDLEAQKQSAGCDEGACLSEIAGAMGAKLVFFGQAGKLGSTIVLTLNVYDAQRGQAVGRQPIQARDISQLPELVGPAIDNMVRPLFETMKIGGAVKPPGLDTLRSSPSLALGARAKEVFDQQEMDVCVDDGDRLKWWFCDKKNRYTENAFVRKYGELTGKRDLDKFEQNRNPNGLLVPGLLVAGGSALVLAGLPVGYYTYVDKTTLPFLSQSADGSTSNSVGGFITVGSIAVGAGAAIYGGILLSNALEYTDGEHTNHLLREPEAREAAARYNEALATKIAHEYASP